MYAKHAGCYIARVDRPNEPKFFSTIEEASAEARRLTLLQRKPWVIYEPRAYAHIDVDISDVE